MLWIVKNHRRELKIARSKEMTQKEGEQKRRQSDLDWGGVCLLVMCFVPVMYVIVIQESRKDQDKRESQVGQKRKSF
jgi:hypothetical protein